MSSIKTLPKDLVNKIAAGEVVENPSSVVKELIENSLDAGATEIIVEIEDQVTYSISVEDNGFGMSEEDLSVCTLRHSTSKIGSLKDLFFIQSFGFRGEALSSISSVSQMEIITRTKKVDEGLHAFFKDEKLITEKINFHIGSKVIAKDLFYNTPARKKYLKSNVAEYNTVLDIVSKYAIVYSAVSFSLYRNGNLSFKTKGNDKILDAISIIHGISVAKNIFPFSASNDLFTIEGYLSRPTLTRSTRNDMVLYINNRYIKSKLITNAIIKGYSNMIMDHRFPIAFLNIKVDFDAVDVNIHPSKRIVKIEHEDDLCDFLEQTVYEAISNNSLIPKVEENKLNPILQSTLPSEHETFSEDKLIPKDVLKSPELIKINSDVQKNFNEVVKNIDDAYSAFKDDFGSHISKIESSSLDKNPAFDSNEKEMDELNKNDSERIKSTDKKQSFGYMNYSDSEIRGLSKDLPSLRILGVFNKLYILCEAGDSLIIIDQHAAEERINYEKYVEVFKSKKIKIQQLVQPIIIELPLRDANALKYNIKYFSKLGFDISEYGQNTFRIDAVPIIFDTIMVNKDLFIDLIEELSLDTSEILDSIEYEKIALTACKASIRAGDSVTIFQIKDLIIRLFNCKNPFACAHGRPTIIEMSSNELDKKFKRIV